MELFWKKKLNFLFWISILCFVFEIYSKYTSDMKTKFLYYQVLNLIILVLLFIDYVNSFNYDLNKVIIHRPSYLQNTYFGYSVAGYKADNDSW